MSSLSSGWAVIITGIECCCFHCFFFREYQTKPEMTRGRGRGTTGRGGRSSVRGSFSTRLNMPTVPIPTTSPQQVGASSSRVPTNAPPVQTSGCRGTPNLHSEPSATTPNQSNPIGEGTSTHSNTISEAESSSSRGLKTLLTISPTTGLEPSRLCSQNITGAFRHDLDPNGISWKNVSKELKDFYYGELQKAFYWDSSIESAVRRKWETKASKRYSDFISKIKKEAIQPDFVHDDVWASWKQLWEDPKCVEKSEIASRNRCGGGNGVAAGTHTGGSISIGEHHKRLVVEKGRDVTPSEIHLHVHTHGHDGKSFVAERSRIVHERYEEILQQQTQTQSEIDQCQAYYQAAGGEKKRRVFGLGSVAQCYYGPNLRGSSGSDASSVPSPNVQPTPFGNMEQFVMQLIPTLTDHLLPVLVERVRESMSSPSNQPTTATNGPSDVVPVVDAPNVDEVRHASGSNDGHDHSTSQ